MAFYLKELLGTSTDVLARLTQALSATLKHEKPARFRYLRIQSRPAGGGEPIEIRIPLRNLARELEQQLPRAAMYRDLPRGRRKPGWKSEFTCSLEEPARDLSGITETQIAEAIRGYRAEKRGPPEITIGGSKRST